MVQLSLFRTVACTAVLFAPSATAIDFASMEAQLAENAPVMPPAEPVGEDLVDVMVDVSTRRPLDREELDDQSFPDAATRLVAMRNKFTKTGMRYAQAVADQMGRDQIQFESAQVFWISPWILFRGVPRSKVSLLRNYPEVRGARASEATRPANATISRKGMPSDDLKWSMTRIGATKAWEKGFTGENIVVGSISTGANGDHEVLRDNFRGDYGWFDPQGSSTSPEDEHGRGTHLLGLAVGGQGIGVAPDAQWMACKACDAEQCMEHDVLSCAEFMTCPFLDNDDDEIDCSKAADVVLLSPDIHRLFSFQDVADVWDRAGIIGVLGSGDNKCPSDIEILRDVMYVAATDSADGHPDFSCSGSFLDLSAPGVNIWSAHHTEDDAYAQLSGTDVAAAHVAGATALLLSANRNVSMGDLVPIYEASVEKQLKPAETLSKTYGSGRLDVFQALTGPTPAPTPTPTRSPRTKPEDCRGFYGPEECAHSYHCTWSDRENCCVWRFPSWET